MRRRTIGVSSSVEAIIRVINYSTSLGLFIFARTIFAKALRSHLASRYYISIYRSIYRRVIGVRAAPMRCNIDDTSAARGIATLRCGVKGTHCEVEGEKKRKTGREGGKIDKEMWATSCRKGQLRIQRIDRIALPRSYGSSHCRDAGAKRERERKREKREKRPFETLSLPPFFPSRLHFPSARPIEEAAGGKGKKKGAGERKGRRREASATRRRRNKRRYVNEIK